MPWFTLRDDAGHETQVHVKLARRPRKRCAHCDTLGAEALCDWPTSPGKTCNKACCDKCSEHIGADTDYCRDHWGEQLPEHTPPPPEQESLF